jgi:hypothetical protein
VDTIKFISELVFEKSAGISTSCYAKQVDPTKIVLVDRGTPHWTGSPPLDTKISTFTNQSVVK